MIKRHNLFTFFTLGLFAVFLESCGPRLSSEAQEFLSQSQEVPACTTDFTYATSQSIAGFAKFYKRTSEPVIANNTITNMILSDPIITPLPIPYAEVAIYTADTKELIQCGSTDVNGYLVGLTGGSLKIPKAARSYIIRLYARTNTKMPNKEFYANAAVKEDPYSNKVYYLESTFTSDATTTTPIELVAYARQTDDLDIKGGAFNIYNNFIQAYTFLDNNLTVSNSELTCLSTPFNIYWKAGFNPVQYDEPSANPNTLDNTSFYKTTQKSLYISGGQVGDVNLSNTDHFDDVITVHEIGHFIEDACMRFDTPGGGHAIIVRIDPRLAWHEAWANYFGTIVLNQRLNYINPELQLQLQNSSTDNKSWSFLFNSFGFSDSLQNIGTGTGFLMDLKKPGQAPGEWQVGQYVGRSFDRVDTNNYPGEGHFREGSISRALFKMSVSSTTLCASCGSTVFSSDPLTFNDIWLAVDAHGGIGDSTNYFTSSNMFLEKLKTTLGTSWSTRVKPVVDSEALQVFSDNEIGTADKKYVTNISGTDYLNWVPYGHKLNFSVGACTTPTTIQARTDDAALTGSNSDQRYSNHFYLIDALSLYGLDSITVNFEYNSGTYTDHDVLLFEQNYYFNDDYTCSTATASSESCTYVPFRGVNSNVIAADRSSAANLSASYSKTLSNLSTKLDPTKKYLLNIRAYTANKMISNATSYKYSIKFNNTAGYLCP